MESLQMIPKLMEFNLISWKYRIKAALEHKGLFNIL